MMLLRLKRDKKGQFIIIATLLVAIMIISVASIMYGAVTYFRHERWEEYLAVIDAVEINSHRLVEISLANYTILAGNQTILRANIDKWQRDLMKTYTGLGIVLGSSLANGPQDIYNVTIQYNIGLDTDWNEQVSFSAANVTFNLNITSVGLYGYKFISAPFVKIEILSAVYDPSTQSLTIKLAVDKEDLIPITNLPKSSFSINVMDVLGQWKSIEDFSLSRYYDDSDQFNRFVYKLYSKIPLPLPLSEVSVTAIETRNIKVVANSTEIIILAH